MKALLSVVALVTSACAHAHGGLVDLSVYDRTEGRRLQVYWHEGRAYVAGRPGNEYQVTLRSRQSQDVLAVVSVDGVNVITGQTADPSQSGYVLSPRGGLDILGWRKSLSQTAAFYFTALPDSYAARTGRPDNVGVIGVALFRRKVEPIPLPQPYGQLKALTRGKSGMSRETLAAFVATLALPADVKARLAALTPAGYIGLAEELARRV